MANIGGKLSTKFFQCGLIAVSGVGIFAEPSFAQYAPSALPPNWDHGGTAKIGRGHMDASGNDHHSTALTDSSEQAPWWSLGIGAGVPDLARLEFHARPWSWGSLFATAAPGWPFNITVEMPSDVIKADTSKGLATAYPAFNSDFKATWGPHITLGGAWHPLGGAWNLSTAAVYRELRLTGSAQSPVRVCSIIEAAKEPPCGDNQAALQTRNELQVTADVRVQTLALKVATGWLWELGENFLVSFELGVFRPISTKMTTNVDAYIVTPDGVPEELSGALADLRDSADRDIKSKADEAIRPLAERTIPVLSLGLSYRI